MDDASETWLSVAREHGIAIALSVAVIVGFAFAIYRLWKTNQELSTTLQMQSELHASKIEELSKTHADAIRDTLRSHTEEIKALADQHTQEKRAMGQRIDQLQEIRVTESRERTEKVMAYIQHIDQFVAKLEATIDILMGAASRRQTR